MVEEQTAPGTAARVGDKGSGTPRGEGMAFGDHGYELLPKVRKIAVLRANGLGDFVFALPALDALRATYPEAEIVYLGKAWHKTFLEGRPGPVDRVVVIPPCGGVGEAENFKVDEAALDAFFEEMRGEHFDLAFQLHGGGRYSNPFTCRLGARLTAGLKAPNAVPLDRWIPYTYFQREVLRYLEAVSLVGAAPVRLEPRLVVTTSDLQEATAAMPDADRPIAVLHPGASDPQRRWPAEKFAAVGDALVEAGVQVVVTGTGDESTLVEAVVASMRLASQNLCGRLSLGGLAGLLSRSAVTVSNDSGPLHLAAAVGAATVGIFWCFNHINAAPFTRARHRPQISWRLDCPACGAVRPYQHCDHHDSFVAIVPVEDVTNAALDLLALARQLVPA